MKILTTGSAGFIGSAFVRLMAQKGIKLVIVDNLDYAADLKRLEAAKGFFKFYKADIRDQKKIEAVFKKEKPSAVVNFAAQSHVDRSIKEPFIFTDTNIRGVQVLLEVSKKYSLERFVHISTDEVYGDIEHGEFLETTPLNPSSPYSASKAAADLLVKAYQRTFKFPAIIVRPSNNYGLWQYPEKLIPLAVLKILRGEKIPVYAQGKNVREWLYVEDSAAGIFEILEKGKIGEVYNLGSGQEKQNIEVVKGILEILKADESRIEFVKDRPGHDIRYKLNSQKIRVELGWEAKVKFEQGLEKTVEWCASNKDWLLGKWKKIAPLYK
ncbi:MAG: dTDP-glucose 4,6-dehydratase [Candidatus Omnitrophica bacterium]|nr:dTDP-glucose 4,6-dehydratase [Candidatus Omnitrophota bacterium]